MTSSERELKYSHDAHSSDRVLRSLQRLCQADGDYHRNIINSIYFDTPTWLLAMEKAASDYLKTKVRLRWYETPDDGHCSACFLEIKRKIGSRRQKIRLPLAFHGDQVEQQLATPEFHQHMKLILAEHAPELAGHDVAPKLLVRYLRHRYIEPFSDSRVALDSQITAQTVSFGHTLAAKRIQLDTAVLEVKGHHEDLPQLLRRLNASNLKKAAFSKYYECFILLTGYQQ